MNRMLEPWIPMVEFLGKVLGEATEVVLQDCKESQCIIAIANGSVTGRTVGSPMTDLSLQIMADESWKEHDYITGYGGMSRTGHSLQCSTFFIKKEEELQGMLCINRDMAVPEQLMEQLAEYLNVAGSPKAGSDGKYSERFSVSIKDMVDDVLFECFGKDYAVIVRRLTQEEKLTVIGKLADKQVFLLKGAVGEVAGALNCSEASVYRYLSKLQK